MWEAVAMAKASGNVSQSARDWGSAKGLLAWTKDDGEPLYVNADARTLLMLGPRNQTTDQP